MKSHEDYMRYVLNLASSSMIGSGADLPVAAIIVKDSAIIAEAVNTREKNQSVIEHAEINAIRAANKQLGDWNLSRCTLYVNLEPCAMCAGAILQSHISSVVFAAYESKTGAFGSKYNLINKNIKILGGILEEDSKKLIQSFFAKLRN